MPYLGRITTPGYGADMPPQPITLEVTPEMMRTLEVMSLESGQPLNVVFTRAIALYQAALRATADGKHVGYAASPDAMEVEFTGLAGIEGR